MEKILVLLVLLFSAEAFAQGPPSQKDSVPTLPKDSVPVNSNDSISYEFFIMDGDTIAIDLNEVVILSKLKFDSELERRKYLILRRKTQKVYPYAKLASERLVELNRRLEKIDTKRKRKQYTKVVQNYIEDQFAAELKKLTRTEGQILVKLIHRQTGETAFDLIKNLKSGWRAFWYNTTASLFDISLKEEYSPQSDKEDYYIEDILQRSFQENLLEDQPSALDFDFLQLTNKWSSPNKGKATMQRSL